MDFFFPCNTLWMWKLNFEELGQKEHWHFLNLGVEKTLENTTGSQDNKPMVHQINQSIMPIKVHVKRIKQSYFGSIIQKPNIFKSVTLRKVERKWRRQPEAGLRDSITTAINIWLREPKDLAKDEASWKKSTQSLQINAKLWHLIHQSMAKHVVFFFILTFFQNLKWYTYYLLLFYFTTGFEIIRKNDRHKVTSWASKMDLNLSF